MQQQPISTVPPHPLTLGDVFSDASPLIQVGFVVLILATLCALVVWATSLAKVRRADAKGLAIALGRLRIIRSGGVLFGLLLAANNVLTMSMGLANMTPTPPLNVIAPGFAEMALAVILGLIATTVAVICERHLEGRMRHAVA